MNPFEAHGIERLSPSAINAWINAPSLFILERLLGFKGQMGCAAHRGTATETGVSAGLFDHVLDESDCIETALSQYDRLTALNGDPNREKERGYISGMVRQGLALRSHGVPIMPNGESRFGSEVQHRIEITLEGVSVPFIGYLDWMYPDEIIDMKTTARVPSAMPDTHLRQASIYKAAHMNKRVRFAYTSDKKMEVHTLTREQFDLAITQVTQAAQRLERFLALSRDSHDLAALVPHNSDTFYFNDALTKAKAVEVFGY